MIVFSPEEIAVVKNCTIFHKLPHKNFEDIINISERKVIKAGDILIHEGEDNAYLYVVIAGEVELHKQDAVTKRDQIIKTLGAGEALGEARLLIDFKSMLSVHANCTTVLLAIPVHEIRDHEEFAIFQKHVTNSIVLSVNERLASGNTEIAKNISEKSIKRKQLIFTLGVITVLTVLLLQLGATIYYFTNSDGFCSTLSKIKTPAEYNGQRW